MKQTCEEHYCHDGFDSFHNCFFCYTYVSGGTLVKRFLLLCSNAAIFLQKYEKNVSETSS